MNFIESYKDYKHNESFIKIFLASQLVFVVFYVFAMIYLENISMRGHGFVLIAMVGLPMLFNICNDGKPYENSNLIKKDKKEFSVRSLIKNRVKIRKEIKKINYKKIEFSYILLMIIIQVVLVILTVCFTEKVYQINKNNPEINPDAINYSTIIALLSSITVQIMLVIYNIKKSKRLIKNIIVKDKLKYKVILEKDEDVIETNSINKINSLIKRGYKYNEDELRKALIE